MPLELLTPLLGEITEVPDSALNVTVVPETGLPEPSFTVAVIVAVVWPSLGTDNVLAVSVELLALAELPWNVTVAVLATVVEPIVAL